MKTLLIGANTDGIGDAFSHRWITDTDERGKLSTDKLYAPTIAELDVTSQNSLLSYLREHGPFDEIVFSAGMNKIMPVDALSFWELNKTFSLNTFALPVLMGMHQRLFPRASGSVVQVVSDAAHTPMRHSLAYCASKAAAEMALRVMARELFAEGWVVNGVNPGVVADTELTDSVDEQVQKLRNWTEQQAEGYEMATSVLRRRVTKDEVAEAIWFLLRGPQALNGTILTINGGK